jgi:hypothetical protein
MNGVARQSTSTNNFTASYFIGGGQSINNISDFQVVFNKIVKIW